MKISLLFVLFLQSSTFAFSQTDNGRLRWSQSRKLSLSDFEIKTKQLETTTSFGQFLIGYKVKGFDFMTKKFNKKVDNFLSNLHHGLMQHPICNNH